MPEMKDARIVIMATHGFEQSELEVPLEELRKTGAHVDVATLDGQEITGWDEADWGRKVPGDVKIADVSVSDYDCLVLPGGQINPDLLRVDDKAVGVVRDFVAGNKIVAAICHAPWLLIEADVMRGRDATSYHSIATDLKNAGANWKDEAVVVSNGIVTSRNPDDLDAFVAKIVEEVKEGEHKRRVA